MRTAITSVIILIFLLVGISLSAEPEFEKSTLRIETQHETVDFEIEIARTPVELSHGLMHRDTLEERAGMLFYFGEPRIIELWMKNTKLSLDMIFIDKEGSIINIVQNTTPYSKTIISSTKDAMAALEVKAGTVKKFNIAPGDKVVHAYFNNHRPQ